MSKTKQEKKLESAQKSVKRLREESKTATLIGAGVGVGAAFLADTGVKYLPAPTQAEMDALVQKKANPIGSRRVKWALAAHAAAVLLGARGVKSAVALAATTSVLTLAVQTTKAKIAGTDLSALADTKEK